MATTSPYQGGQQASTYSELDEHAVISGVGGKKVHLVNTLVQSEYDYIAVTYPDTSTEVYTFKTGGSGGTTVATVTLVYSDAGTKAILASVTKT